MEEYEPAWESLERHRVPEWLKDSKFGIYFHWGPYSVPAFETEWYPHYMYRSDWEEKRGRKVYKYHKENYGDPSEFGYKDFIPEFDGKNFDAEEWATICKEAGAKFAGISAVHHDGFCMWDSELTDWNSAEMGPEVDVVGELAEAVRNEGMKFVTAFHHAHTWWYCPRIEGCDTMDPDYAGLYGPPHEEGENPPQEYYEDWRDKVIEVMDNYRPDLLWFDCGWGNAHFSKNNIYRREVLSHYYNKAIEWGKEVEVCHKKNIPIGTGLVDLERMRMEDVSEHDWITDTSVDRKAWGYVQNPEFKNPKTLVTGLADRVSKNGNLLLNVGPKPDGTIPDEPKKLLRDLGNWLKINGDAIYGSRPWRKYGEGPTKVKSKEFEDASQVTYTPKDIRFTRKENKAYVIFLDWPGNKAVIETDFGKRVSDFERGRGDYEYDIELLGSEGKLSWNRTEKGIEVVLPDEKPCDYAYTLQIKTK